MAAGATALAWGLAVPAYAHGKQEPEGSVHGDKDCSDLAETFNVDQDWQQLDIDDLSGDYPQTESIGQDGEVSITITDDSLLEWTSTIGIDAVLVKGSNEDKGGYFYLYAPGADDEEETSDYDLGVPPWHTPEVNQIVGVQFCFDEEHSSTTAPPTTAPTTVPPTTPPETEMPTTAPPTSVEDTTPTTAPATTAPPTTQPVGEQLPRTGSDTMPLLAGAGALIALGAAAVFGRRYLQGRA